MNSTILLLCVIVYFVGLLVISYFTSRNSDNQSFFNGNKKSKWWLVAFGMIGTSLSGVTFISVPGTVGKLTGSEYIYGGFEYYMMVIGFFLGYFQWILRHLLQHDCRANHLANRFLPPCRLGRRSSYCSISFFSKRASRKSRSSDLHRFAASNLRRA